MAIGCGGKLAIVRERNGSLSITAFTNDTELLDNAVFHFLKETADEDTADLKAFDKYVAGIRQTIIEERKQRGLS
jgi:hypothetical protein